MVTSRTTSIKIGKVYILLQFSDNEWVSLRLYFLICIAQPFHVLKIFKFITPPPTPSFTELPKLTMENFFIQIVKAHRIPR